MLTCDGKINGVVLSEALPRRYRKEERRYYLYFLHAADNEEPTAEI